jgi:hypothetical protein
LCTTFYTVLHTYLELETRMQFKINSFTRTHLKMPTRIVILLEL